MSLPDIREYVSYDKDTGHLTWIKSSSPMSRANVGQRAGSSRSDGYRMLTVKGHRILEHRAAWFIHTGRWPSKQLDHINRVKDDNRICNLRDVPQSVNVLNVPVRRDNRSGITGVCFEKSSRKWKAQMNIGGKRKNLGRFKSIEEAHNRVLQEQRDVLKEGNGL